MKNFFNYILLNFLFSFFLIVPENKAVIVSPIADLVGQPFSQQVDLKYDQLPLSGGLVKPFASCPRMHQLLFNEVVTVIKERNDQVFVEVPHLFYITERSKQRRTRFWMQKKHCLFFDTLKKMNLDLSNIPEPISFKQKQTSFRKTISLVKPFYDQITDATYSAGTRFIFSKKNFSNYIIQILDPKTLTFKKTTIPRELCIEPESTKSQQIQQFISILKSWTPENGQYIPYVWGGSSFVTMATKPFCKFQSKNCSYYTLEDTQNGPKCGYDCASLIWRAAHMSGIPFYYKNTTTIAKYLKPTSTSIKAGDIIWIPWHVMVVADLKKNTLIEARHYNHDYGKIHEIPLQEQFLGIRTYKDLMHAFKNKIPLKRINKKGKVTHVVSDFKILSIESVWTHATY